VDPGPRDQGVQPLARSGGLPDVRLHDLRHFGATRLLAARVPVRMVSGRLGHANAATTLGVYAHFMQESDRHSAAVLGALVAPNHSQVN
jgi:integrase